MNWDSIISGAVSGGALGTLATLFAPWVNFGVEKKKIAHESKKELIARIRTLSGTLGRREFRRTPEFYQIEPFLDGKTLTELNKPNNHLRITEGDPAVDMLAMRLLLSDLARIERDWKLI